MGRVKIAPDVVAATNTSFDGPLSPPALVFAPAPSQSQFFRRP